MGTTINPFTGKIDQSSPPLRFNPLAGAFQFSGGNNRVVFDPVSSGFVFAKVGDEPDPLAGIPFRMRFETTWNKVTLRPMWQDAARTILVTSEGDVVGSMGPSGLEFTPSQNTNALKGIYFNATDGTPYIDLDGVDDWYETGAMVGPIVYTCLIRSKSSSFNTFWAPIENSEDNADRWGFFSAGNTGFLNSPGETPTEVRLNGVTMPSPVNSLSPVDEWMVLTVTTASPPSTLKGLFQLAQTFFGFAEVIGFVIYQGTPSDINRDQVESFYESLKPS